MAFTHGNEEYLALAQQFEPSMAKQHGMDIACIPYSCTPFALVDAARSLSPEDSTFGPFTFNPSTVRSDFVRSSLLSCYGHLGDEINSIVSSGCSQKVNATQDIETARSLGPPSLEQ